MNRLVVTTAELSPDDSDLSTRRFWRDPKHRSGTGRRAQLVPLGRIRVPNHPDYIAQGGERLSSLYWCSECSSYQHPETHPCTAKPRDCFDSGEL